MKIKNNYKFLLVIYLVIIMYLIIISCKEHKKQDQIYENFTSNNLLKFKNKNIKYSQCREKCLVNYDKPEQQKACKAYCKCKKKCNGKLGSKKCLKNCKEKKLNIFRDDKDKMMKIELKQELKNQRRKMKKEKKINELKEIKKKEKENTIKLEKKQGYFAYLVNNYFGEDDRTYLVGLNQNTKNFVKDCKNIFKF